VVVALVAGVAAVVLVTRAHTPQPRTGTVATGQPDGSAAPGDPADPTDPPVSPQIVPPAGTGRPTNVTLRDDGASVTVTWVDPTGSGSVPFAVSTRTTAGKYLPAIAVAAGRHSTVVPGLDPKKDYCFIVTAIYSANTLAPAAPVCTHR
jgi:hypothetical protein